jgi:hypothetical protein
MGWAVIGNLIGTVIVALVGGVALLGLPIDLAGAAEGENQYSVTLKVPAGVGIVEMNPQKVRVLITREQG